MGQNKPFTEQFCHMKTDFIKYIKLVAQENIKIMKTQCCILVVSIAKLKVVRVIDVFTNYFLQCSVK